MNYLREELEALKVGGLHRSMRLVQGAQGPEIMMGGKRVVLLCSNNYLGLAGDPRIAEAAAAALENYGFGSGASRLISGNMEAHEALESRIAEFKGTEAALVFTSGWHANVGAISALAGRGDLILSDELNHASIVDGCRLSMASVCVYSHRDLNALEDGLRSSGHRRRLIVTDGVFSMDGDIAPLPEMAELARQYNAMLMVDEAHGTGVFGRHGRGIVDHFGLGDMVDIQMGTLGKALGCFGAYIAGGRDLIEYLLNRARSFIFTTALPPALCAAAVRAIDITEEEEWRRERLHENVRFFSEGLRAGALGTNGPKSPIIPLIVGDEARTMAFCEELLEKGVFCQGIRPPTVPSGTSRLRMTLMATHTPEHLTQVLKALNEARHSSLL